MIFYWDKKHKKRLHVLEADIIAIKTKHWFDDSSSKDTFFTGRVPNDHYFAWNIIILIDCIYFETPCKNTEWLDLNGMSFKSGFVKV